MINKKSDFLASAASFIPILGGSIYGGMEPPSGMSARQGADVLGSYGSTGGITAPIGMLMSKGILPTSKKQVQKILIKALISSSLGTAVGSRFGKVVESKNYTQKNSNEQGITGGQSTPGFLGQLTKEIVLDPPVDSVKNLSSSANLVYSGDSAGAGGKLLSGIGNAILAGSSFVPALGAAGKGIRLLSKITGAGAKALKLTNAANKINRAGAISSKFLRAPVTFLKKTPVLNTLTGNKNIFKYTKPQAGQKFLQPSNLLRLGGNAIKLVGNSTPNLAAGLGLSGAGSLMYSNSPSGQMNSMLDSSVFSDIIGKDLSNEISGLSSKDKLRVFQHLKNNTNIPQRVLGDWTNS